MCCEIRGFFEVCGESHEGGGKECRAYHFREASGCSDVSCVYEAV